MMSFPRLQKHAPLTRDFAFQTCCQVKHRQADVLSFADEDNFLESLGPIFTCC